MYKYRFFFLNGMCYDYKVSGVFSKKEMILGAAALMKQDYITTDDRAINIANVVMIEVIDAQEDTK